MVLANVTQCLFEDLAVRDLELHVKVLRGGPLLCEMVTFACGLPALEADRDDALPAASKRSSR